MIDQKNKINRKRQCTTDFDLVGGKDVHFVKNPDHYITREQYVDWLSRVNSLLQKQRAYITHQLYSKFSRKFGFHPLLGMKILGRFDTSMGMEAINSLSHFIKRGELTNSLEVLEQAGYTEERALMMLGLVQLLGDAS